jgi:hypothetical protein
MRYGVLGSLTTLLTGAGIALAQPQPASDPGAVDPASFRKPPHHAAADPYCPAPPGPSMHVPAEEGNAFAGPPTHGKKPLLGDDGPPPGEPKLRPEFPKIPWEPQGNFWVGGEYLLWAVKRDQTGALISTGPPESRGIPGNPGTQTLFDGFNYGTAAGVRVTAGYANPDGDYGIEASGFMLEKRSARFAAASDASGNPVIVRAARNALDNRPTGEVVSFPGAFSGQIALEGQSEVWGFDGYVVCPIYHDCVYSAELLAGARYLDLREQVNIAQTTTILPGGVAGFQGDVLFAPTTVNLGEHFGTRNHFYGGQLGAMGEMRFGNFFLNSLVKVGLGATHQVAEINGITRATGADGVARTVSGGVAALSNNIGHNSQDRFAVVPEVNVNLGFNLFERARLFVGYTFLYWSDVIRPGDQASTPVNPALVPTSLTFGSPVNPPRPVPVFSRSEFWVQGISFGVAFRY